MSIIIKSKVWNSVQERAIGIGDSLFRSSYAVNERKEGEYYVFEVIPNRKRCRQR